MNLKNLVPWNRDRGPAATRYNADSPFLSLHREMNRVFDDFFRDFGLRDFDEPLRALNGAGWPSVEVRETDQEIKVIAELPGMDERDVEVTYADGMLTLKGEKRMENDSALYSERWAGSFERRLAVGKDVDPDNVKATFRNGLLTVTMAKKPEARRQVKRIAIN